MKETVFALTQCVEIARKEGRKLIYCFFDVKKAYNKTPCTKLFDRFSSLGLPETLLSSVRRRYLDKTLTEHFGVVQNGKISFHTGLRQGCPLSPILYLVCVSELAKKPLQSKAGFRLNWSTTGMDSPWRPGLVFADDFVLLVENPADLQRLFSICAAGIRELGLCFSARKTTVVQFAGATQNLILTLDGEPISIGAFYH